MIVEDEPPLAEMLSYNLDKAGYRTVVAGTGEEALGLVEMELPELAVVDWMLPERSGLEVCRILRNKKETIYCYSDIEKHDAIERLSPKPEITRFKGLGEISPNEFKNFIGENMRLDPIIINKDTSIEKLLSFYMGKNTPERQSFIIDNLKIDLDKA